MHSFAAHLSLKPDSSAYPFQGWAARETEYSTGTCCEVSAVGCVRLTNRETIASRLFGKDRQREGSDLELALHAYKCWGLPGLNYLRGAYALALWDGARQRFVCIRDALGTVPLYWHRSSAGITVASSLPLIRDVADPSIRVNEIRVARYLLQIDTCSTDTFFANIERLAPGHCLIARPPEITIQEVDILGGHEELCHGRDAAYIDGYRDRFKRAVRRSLRGAGRKGTWLSGGLDSSAVTCVARDICAGGESPLDVFSLTFTAPESDERRFIEAVHAEGGTQSHYVSGDRLNPFDNLGDLLGVFGEPFDPPNLFMNMALLRAAQQAGVDRVLDGFLGDNVVGHGTEYLTELADRGHFVSLFREMRSAVQRHGRRSMYGTLLHSHVLKPLIWDPIRRGFGSVIGGGSLGVEEGYRLFNSDFFASLDPGIFQALQDRPCTRRARTAHRQEVTSSRLTAALETVFVASTAYGIDVRFPFADRDLVEYCLSLPPTTKCRDGWTRWIARQAMQDQLPSRVSSRRSKGNLYPAFRRALLRTGIDGVRETIFGQADCAKEYLNIPAVHALFHRAVGRGTRPEEEVLLWRIVLLIRWLGTLGQNPPNEVTFSSKHMESMASSAVVLG